MKFFIVLLCVTSLQLSAKVFSQQISIRMSNATFKEVVREIEKQTGLTFLFSDMKVSHLKNLNVDFTQATLERILNHCLSGADLSYQMMENAVVIVPGVKRSEPQQQTVIKGIIVDRAGTPLPGVTVLIKGTQVGSSSDADGRFAIEVGSSDRIVLVFSFVGMEKKEVSVKDSKELRVVMEEAVENMKEVVVTGIFQRKKESFTGSSQTYTAKELKMVGNQNVIQSLKTLDPSLLVMESKEWGSDPNRLPEMEIRGKTSIVGLKSEYGTDPNQPLFILDGFETTLQTIMDLSIERVANITILKDAASTAIYGSKAANGVIVVETKQPEMGKLRVSYGGNFMVQFPDLSDYNLMNSSEKLEFEKLAGYYTGTDLNNQLVKDKQYNSILAEIRRGVNTYWMSKPLRTSFNHRHNLYAEGGDAAMRYGLGVNYGKNKGVMNGSARDVVSVNIDLSYRLKTLKFTNKATVDYSIADREPVQFSTYSGANPYYRKSDEIYLEKDMPNPLYVSGLNYLDQTKELVIKDNFQVEWDIVGSLRARGRVGLIKTISETEEFTSPKHPEFVETDLLERGEYAQNRMNAFSYEGELSLTYGKLFAEKHQLNLVGGWNFNESNSVMNAYSVVGFMDDYQINPGYALGYKENDKPDYSTVQSRATSFFFNVNYAYANRYLLDFIYRADGTSVFGVNNKFTNTWSVGLAWNIHNEAFLSGSSWLSMLKVRASVGNPGNQNFSAYQAMKTYAYNSWLQNVFGSSMLIDKYGNPNLKWQKTLDKNVGVDLVFWNNRIKITADYYHKDTDPLLVFIGMPTSSGSTSLTTNLGGQVNQGVSGTVSVSPVYRPEKELFWTVNFNFKRDIGKFYGMGKALENLNEANRENRELIRYFDGGSPDDIWAVRSLGIDPATGNELFLKKDGSETFKYDASDEVIVGNSRPDLEGVVGTTLNYKGLSVSVNFRYCFGARLFASALYDKVENITRENLAYNQDKRALYDRWQKPGDKAKYKGISLTDKTPVSSRFVVTENTFSGESVSVGYETMADWVKAFGAASASFRIYMNDIFRISSFKEERGIEYPFARSVSFSLNVRF